MPTPISLGVIALVLTVVTVASLVKTCRDPSAFRVPWGWRPPNAAETSSVGGAPSAIGVARACRVRLHRPRRLVRIAERPIG
jgi:hypothetical protein